MSADDLQEHADRADCFVVWKGDEAAVGLRHYDYCGVRVLRRPPDNRDFRPAAEWLAMTLQEVRANAF